MFNFSIPSNLYEGSWWSVSTGCCPSSPSSLSSPPSILSSTVLPTQAWRRYRRVFQPLCTHLGRGPPHPAWCHSSAGPARTPSSGNQGMWAQSWVVSHPRSVSYEAGHLVGHSNDSVQAKRDSEGTEYLLWSWKAGYEYMAELQDGRAQCSGLLPLLLGLKSGQKAPARTCWAWALTRCLHMQ